MSAAADGTRLPLLAIEGLTVTSRIDGRDATLASAIDLTVEAGETVGIVGESGSGKSVTARALVGLLPAGLHATGAVRFGGRNLLELKERERRAVRGREIALVFQDPYTMLNPLMRCGRQIGDGLRPSERGPGRRRRVRLEAIRRLGEVGITDPQVAERFPFELSGGMRQRVGIAAALAGDPALLVADEPSTALDVTTQKEMLALLKTLQVARGMGLILITHDLRVAFSTCDRIYVLYAGSLLEVGPAAEIQRRPLHPYTLGLLLSDPPSDRRLETLPAIPGSVPKHIEVEDQCAFAARCEWAAAECMRGATRLQPAGNGRLSACRRIGEIGDDLARRRELPAGLVDDYVHRATSGSLVRAVDIRKTFVRRGHRVEAVAGVSFEVGENEGVGLVGESGSGKTTIARCLLGLETVSSGSLSVGGVDLSPRSGARVRYPRDLYRKIQMVFQDPYSSLNPVRTVGSALREALLARDPRLRNADAGVRELLAQVGLSRDYAVRKPVALSGGERQRVAIARALAMKPSLLVCDEPVSSLDVSMQAQILNLLGALRAELGVSYVFITHDLAVVRQVTERTYVLHRGAVVEEGSTDEILDNPRHPYTRRLVASIPGTDGRG